MSRHVTYRGVSMDMDSMRRDNEKSIAIGNMPVNAKGDHVRSGQITKTADQIARENHRVQSAIISSGLKGPIPAAPPQLTEAPKKTTAKKETPKKEVELPSGDIVIEEDNGTN